MSHYDYESSQDVEMMSYKRDWSFVALVMGAMRRADTDNSAALKAAFPAIYAELEARYNAPGGMLPGETMPRSPVGTGT